METTNIEAAGGAQIAMRAYAPVADAARGSVVIGGDELMTLRGTHRLIDLYENAPREVLRLAPSDVAVRRIGHIGLFRSEHEAALWPRVNGWLGGLAGIKGAAA